MNKKTLTIIIIVFVVIILGMLAVSFFVFRGPSEDNGEVGGLRDFFPFGKSENTSDERPPFLGDIKEGGEDKTSVGDTPLGRPDLELKQLTTEPVAGAMSTSSLRGETTVRYVERTTGNTYEIEVANSNQKRLSNTTIPAVREAFFDGGGLFVNLRYLNENDVIKTFAARVLAPGETTEKEGGVIEKNEGVNSTDNIEPVGDQTTGRLTGTFLEDDITHMAVSPSGEQFFYVMPFGTSIIGIIENFLDNKKNQIFDSPFTEWLPQWPEKNTLALTTKASGTTDGFLYFLNIKTEEFEKILGDVPGLTTNVNPDATAIFYSESTGGGFSSHLLDIYNYDRKKINISTLPEKCVWSTKNTTIIYCGVPGTVPNNVYPDVWYQGIVSFSDTIWKINVDANTIELLVIPTVVAEQEIDVINPFLGPNEGYLFFTNKKDSTLWSLRLDR